MCDRGCCEVLKGSKRGRVFSSTASAELPGLPALGSGLGGRDPAHLGMQ